MDNLRILSSIFKKIPRFKNITFGISKAMKFDMSGTSAAFKRMKPTPVAGFKKHKQYGYCSSMPKHAILLQRFYSNESQPKKVNLMDFEMITWPSFIKTLKNWIYTGFIVQPHFDNEFNLQTFVEGTKQAVVVVSQLLSEGKFEQLEGLLTPECITEIQKNITLLNATQRHELAVNKRDIYFSFPYELGILFDEEAQSKPQKREVEITVVHHVLRGYAEMMDRGDVIPMHGGMAPEFQNRIFILNYRFIRNYTKGVSDQWTINLLNHFKPVD